VLRNWSQKEVALTSQGVRRPLCPLVQREGEGIEAPALEFVIQAEKRGCFKPALKDLEAARAPGVSRALGFGSSVSAVRFENHFADAPPSALAKKHHGGEQEQQQL
jgi:hypothetical protein